MKAKEIIENLESLKCPKCGGERKLPMIHKWALTWQVWRMQRKGFSDAHVAAWANRMLIAMCLG